MSDITRRYNKKVIKRLAENEPAVLRQLKMTVEFKIQDSKELIILLDKVKNVGSARDAAKNKKQINKMKAIQQDWESVLKIINKEL